MTVSTTSNRIVYTGNGSTTVFAFPYKFTATADIVVYVNGVLQSSGYTVGTPSDTGANITFSVAPAASAAIVILADPARTQSSSLPSTGPFPAKTVEAMSDKLTLLVQRLYDLATRSFTLSDADTTTASTTLPTPSANKLIGWNASGNGLQNVDVNTMATIVAYGTAKSDTFTGDGATKNFTLSANPGAQANLDVDIGGVTQAAGIDFTWTSGTTLTFTSAPPNGVRIHARYMQALAQGSMDGAATSFVQSGTGAVVRTAQDKMREVVSVKDFGAVGDGVTDDSAAIQAAINTGKNVIFPTANYNIGTTGITLTNHNQTLDFQNSVLLYSGANHAVDATPISNVFPQGVTVKNLNITCSASCLSGFRWRLSYSNAENVTVAVTASNSTAWRIDTDFTYGTGPYYNQFRNCHAQGKVGIIGGVTNQTGWLFTTSVSAGTRGPNANTFLPGRTANFTNAWVIAGSQNRIIAPTVEGTVSGGQVFVFENIYGAGAGCNTNVVSYPYVEGSSGANFLKFGTNSQYNHMERPYVTSLGAGVYLNDTSGNNTNTMLDYTGLRFGNTASTDTRTLDWYEEGTFTPVVAGSSTAGANTYAIQIGRFQRIGNRVHVQISLLMSTKDAAMAGNIKITGLPYAAANVTNSSSSLAVSDWYLSLDAGYTQVGGRIDPNNSFIYLVQLGSTKSVALLTPLNVYSSTELFISGSYEV